MGDGIQRKYAVILNGDTEARHLQNVDRAVEFFAKEGYGDIVALSPAEPQGQAASYSSAAEFSFTNIVSAFRKGPNLQYGTATPGDLRRLLATINPDDDDLIAVYITGHGGEDAGGNSCAVMQDGSCLPFERLAESLGALEYGKRIVISDACLAGNSILLFANERTAVKSLGGKGENVSCQQSAPFFFSDQVTDSNGDGFVSVEERISYELENGKPESHPVFFSPFTSLSLSGQEGTPAFPQEVREVHDKQALQGLLSGLKLGQLALVTFSADWCGPCQEYAPRFDALAESLGGNYLMIRAEGRNGSERDWAEWGVEGYPTVAFVDYLGHAYRVKDRDWPLAGLSNESSAKSAKAKMEAELEDLLPELAATADLVLEGQGYHEFSNFLGQAYLQYELFDPPFSTLPLRKRKGHLQFLASSLDLIFSKVKDPSIKVEHRVAYLEGLARSLTGESTNMLLVNIMLRSSQWPAIKSRFEEIAKDPHAPEELRGVAQSMPDILEKMRKYLDLVSRSSGFRLPKFFLKDFRNWRQSAWILANYLNPLVVSLNKSKGPSPSENALLVEALFYVYRHRQPSVGKLPQGDSGDESQLNGLICTALSFLDFNPSDPRYSSLFYGMLREKESHLSGRATLLASSLDRAMKRNPDKDSFEIAWLRAVLAEILQDPSDEQSRLMALAALDHLRPSGFLEKPVWAPLKAPLADITQERSRWRGWEENGEYKTYWRKQPVGEFPTWGYVDLATHLQNAKLAEGLAMAIPGSNDHIQVLPDEFQLQIPEEAPPESYRFVGE